MRFCSVWLLCIQVRYLPCSRCYFIKEIRLLPRFQSPVRSLSNLEGPRILLGNFMWTFGHTILIPLSHLCPTSYKIKLTCDLLHGHTQWRQYSRRKAPGTLLRRPFLCGFWCVTSSLLVSDSFRKMGKRLTLQGMVSMKHWRWSYFVNCLKSCYCYYLLILFVQ